MVDFFFFFFFHFVLPVTCDIQTHQPWMSRAYDPCSERYADLYFNHPEVQKALHANITGIPYSWKSCRYMIYKHYWRCHFETCSARILTKWFIYQWYCWELLGGFSTIHASYIPRTHYCWYQDMGIQVRLPAARPFVFFSRHSIWSRSISVIW